MSAAHQPPCQGGSSPCLSSLTWAATAGKSWREVTTPKRSVTEANPGLERESHHLGPAAKDNGKQSVPSGETSYQGAQRGLVESPTVGTVSSSSRHNGCSQEMLTYRAEELGARTAAWQPCWVTCVEPGSCPGDPGGSLLGWMRCCSVRSGKGTGLPLQLLLRLRRQMWSAPSVAA